MKSKIFTFCIIALFISSGSFASRILIPMDEKSQNNHLKAYGIAYAALADSIQVDWLLNYRGGSYAMKFSSEIVELCDSRHVSYSIISNTSYNKIRKQIERSNFDGAVVSLKKAPKIAVYTPGDLKQWDDAVTLALDYAEVPYDKIYVDEVLDGSLDKYDWIHLHHEDFTGQFGKFWAAFKAAKWYRTMTENSETLASRHGYKNVAAMQLAVAKKIREFVVRGGNLFAMCSATETFDIALAAEGVDICPAEFDGTPVDSDANTNLNFDNCLAFKDFAVSINPYNYQHSDIDASHGGVASPIEGYFHLYPFPAKSNLVSSMLCQNHTTTIKGFMGQTTSFRKEVIKPGTIIMGAAIARVQRDIFSADTDITSRVGKYIHGECGKGTWTFYGGHDPEDYQHLIENPATDLSKFPHSPGYRLILNNILYPAAQRDPVPTIVISGDSTKSFSLKQDNLNSGNSAVTTTKIQVYPNPASKEIMIAILPSDDNNVASKETKINHVTIMSIDGKVCYSKDFDTDKAQIDVRDYIPGTYLILVNGVYSGNVIKN